MEAFFAGLFFIVVAAWSWRDGRRDPSIRFGPTTPVNVYSRSMYRVAPWLGGMGVIMVVVALVRGIWG